MRSRHHFPISVLVGAVCAATVETALEPVAPVAYAGLVGTFVDLDHFAIARLKTGSWEPLWRCVADPRLAFFDQANIFPDGAVGPRERLASHVLLGGLLTGALALVAPGLALVTGAVLAVHVLADVAWDYWRPGRERRAGE